MKQPLTHAPAENNLLSDPRHWNHAGLPVNKAKAEPEGGFAHSKHGSSCARFLQVFIQGCQLPYGC